MFYNDPISIDSDSWIRVLGDKIITNEKDLDILKIIYECENNEARASFIASKLSIRHHGEINLEISRFSKRVVNKLGVEPPHRADGKVRWWHVPFLGYEKGGKFPWILRPELTVALEMKFGKILSEVRLPEEISIDKKAIIEGKAKQVYVNIFERIKPPEISV